jgi:hypothetical protein
VFFDRWSTSHQTQGLNLEATRELLCDRPSGSETAQQRIFSRKVKTHTAAMATEVDSGLYRNPNRDLYVNLGAHIKQRQAVTDQYAYPKQDWWCETRHTIRS